MKALSFQGLGGFRVSGERGQRVTLGFRAFWTLVFGVYGLEFHVLSDLDFTYLALCGGLREFSAAQRRSPKAIRLEP